MICIRKLTRLMPKFCISGETTLFLPRLYLPKQNYKQHSSRQISVSLFQSHNRLCFPISLSDNKHNRTQTTLAAVSEAVPVAAVKLICTRVEPNFSLPWQKKKQEKSSSSGFVIEGRRILTNAHCVEAYTQVKLQKRDSSTLYTAKVLAIGIECDIALLTVDNDEFWDGVVPVQFGELPALQDAVTIVGYPKGGETISVTRRVVSRIEIISYGHGLFPKLLGFQVEASIISGNSGGPVFNEKGSCIGIGFQTWIKKNAKIGEVIPTPVIRHFIQDYEKNGAYTGFPELRLGWEKMENPDYRTSVGMKDHQNGVRISWIDPISSEAQVLKVSDIILSFDGVDIANDGTVPFGYEDHIDFSWLVSQKYVGDVASIKVLRNSEILEVDIKLDSFKRMIPAHNNDNPPSYYIIAGFVFTTVSVPYLRSEYGKKYKNKAPNKLTEKLSSPIKFKNEQIVVVSQVLEADINIGYEEIFDSQVLAFNGNPVTNLKSLADMIESCSDEFLKFDFEDEQTVVLQTKAAKKATQDILTTHCIPSTMSDDLKPKFVCGCSSHSRCCDELKRFNDFYRDFITRTNSR